MKSKRKVAPTGYPHRIPWMGMHHACNHWRKKNVGSNRMASSKVGAFVTLSQEEYARQLRGSLRVNVTKESRPGVRQQFDPARGVDDRSALKPQYTAGADAFFKRTVRSRTPPPVRTKPANNPQIARALVCPTTR